MNGRGFVNFAVEQLYQVYQDLMNMSDDTICCLSFSVVLKGTVPAPVPSGSMRQKRKKLFLAKTVVETCRTPDPAKTTHRCVCVCVWSSVATVIKSGSFCVLRDVSYLVSERNVPPLHHST